MRLNTKYLVLLTNLTTNTAHTADENKIPNVSNLVKKNLAVTNINEIENKINTDHNTDKYITTQEFKKLTSKNVSARLTQANLASKNDIANSIKKTDFDDKLKNLNKNVTSYKTKHVLVKTELNELSEKVKAI